MDDVLISPKKASSIDGIDCEFCNDVVCYNKKKIKHKIGDENNDIQKFRVRRPSWASWWFESLIQNSPANDNALHAKIFTRQCGNGTTAFLAVPRAGKYFYYWCQHVAT